MASHLAGEVSIPILMNSAHNIYASAIIGVLPLIHGKGCDAIKMSDGETTPIELKTSYIDHSNLWVNQSNNKIYKGKANNHVHRRSIYDRLKAKYLVYNLDDKCIDTYLVCIDSDTSEIICSYSLSGTTIREIFGKEESRPKFTKDITLRMFIQHGTVSDTVVPQIGHEEWCEHMKTKVPVLPLGAKLNVN